MRVLKNKKILVIFALILIVVLAFISIQTWLKKTTEIPAEAPRAISFDELFADFYLNYKKIVFDIYDEKPEAKDKLVANFKIWQEIGRRFRSEPRPGFKQNREWLQALDKISKLEELAAEAAIRDEFNTGLGYHLQISQELNQLWEDNNKLFIGDEMLAFYEDVREVVKVESKEEMNEPLLNLKRSFLSLKEAQLGGDYKARMAELEKIIAKLDRLLIGPEWRQAKDSLEPFFVKLYLKHG